MSRAKSAFWGSVSSQVFMIITMLLTVVITPLVLKFLDKEEYGFYTILFQLVGYLSMLDFGLGVAIARNLAANRGEDEESKQSINRIISTSFFTYSILGVIVVIIGLCFIPYLPRVFNMSKALSEVAVPITLTLSIFVGIQFPLKVFNSIFYAHQRQLLSNTMGFTLSLLSSILPLIFLHLGLGLWSFVYTNIIGSLIGIIVTFVLIRKFYSFLKVRFMFFEKRLLVDMFHFGFFSFLNSIAVQIVFFTDRFFIGSLVSLTAATMFSLTAKASELSRELIFRITDSAYPAMVEISSKENESKLRDIHQKLLLITVCCASIAAWVIFIINPWFVHLWVGENFFAGRLILALTIIIMLQLTLLHVSAVCLYGMGTIKGISILSIFEATLNLFLTMWLGKMYGIKGILIATIIASWLTAMWYVPKVTMKQLGIGLKDYLVKPLLIPFLIISSLGITIYLLTLNLFDKFQLTWFSFFTVTILITGVLAAFAWFVFLEKYFINYIPLRFKRYLSLSSRFP